MLLHRDVRGDEQKEGEKRHPDGPRRTQTVARQGYV
jgi:hypothetical protein